jgi:hypothetical protein
LELDGPGLSLTNTGTIRLDTLSVRFGAALSYDGGTLDAGYIDLHGSQNVLHLGIDFTNTGALSLESTTVDGPGTLRNLGRVTIRGRSSIQSITNGEVGVMPIGQWDITIVGDSSWGSATLSVPNGVTNYGTIELTSESSPHDATLVVLSGSLANEPQGVISTLAGTGGARTIIAQIVNHGTMHLEPGTVLEAPPGLSVTHSNSGVIDVSGGDLTVNLPSTISVFQNTGHIHLGPGRRFSVHGGTFKQDDAGTSDGPGEIEFTGVTGVFNTPINVAALTLNSSIVTYAADFSMATTALALSSSRFTLAGAFTNPAGKTLVLYGSSLPAPSVHNLGMIVARGPVPSMACSRTRPMPRCASKAL